MRINKRVTDGKWCKFEEGTEFKIRPFRLSTLSNLDAGMDNLKLQFNYCLVDWKGVENESGGKLNCNDENKLWFFDFGDAVREFVFAEADKMKVTFDKEIKN